MNEDSFNHGGIILFLGAMTGGLSCVSLGELPKDAKRNFGNTHKGGKDDGI